MGLYKKVNKFKSNNEKGFDNGILKLNQELVFEVLSG
jgi:hypothetical protein